MKAKVLVISKINSSKSTYLTRSKAHIHANETKYFVFLKINK